MTQDEQHLNLLSVFHYVVGGLTAFFSCMLLIMLLMRVGMGIAIFAGVFDGKDAPPKFFAWFFILFQAVFMLCGWTLATLMIVAGRKLKRRASRTFCLVIAGLECIVTPFGTVLGIFTIIVLVRDSVKELFSANHAMQATPNGAPDG